MTGAHRDFDERMTQLDIEIDKTAVPSPIGPALGAAIAGAAAILAVCAFGYLCILFATHFAH